MPQDSRVLHLCSACLDVHSVNKLHWVQLCVENAGRPAAAALAQFVRATAAAYKAGHSMSRLQLEVRLGGFGEVDLNTASCRLTETDKAYRQQFIDTVRAHSRQQLRLNSTHGMLNDCRSHRADMLVMLLT